MNRLLSAILAATAVIATGQALADDITIDNEPFTSTASRATVQAELSNFRTVRNPWSIAYDPLAGFTSSLTREQVRAEYIADRDSVAAFMGEDSGSFALGQDLQGNEQVAGAGVARGGE
jgi:hypothetical protein